MRKLAPTLIAVFLSACSMAESSLIDSTMNNTCTLDGGSYYLPRTLVKVVVNEVQTSGKSEFIIDTIDGVVHQDRRYPYCLDYLKSPTSEDTFVVSRNEKLLLQKVTSVADDKSKEIAKSVIQAIFVGLSGDPQFGQTRAEGGVPLLGKTKRFEVEYDPFDEDQAAVVNDSLKDFGYCLVLEHARFLARSISAEAYCDHPLGGGRRETRMQDASADKFLEAPPAHSQGIFYRPRLPYNFAVLQKDNLQARGGWRLLGTNSVLFENASPIFSIAVDRTYFAKRKTTLQFTDGALQDVTIEKGSELVGFVEIPLTIAQSVVALPTSILQVKIDDTNNRAKLINAQKQLLDSHQAYLTSLKTFKEIDSKSPIKEKNIKPEEELPFGAGAKREMAQSQPSSEEQANRYNGCMADCGKDTGPAGQCHNFCQCRVTQCTVWGDEVACDAQCSGLNPKK